MNALLFCPNSRRHLNDNEIHIYVYLEFVRASSNLNTE